ncbi:DUF998 domain-containing protein [Nonomuraea sp. K274]|uniref:DUF998 domain-containing protein n=1 Tax=Nonomuraea cypriaca TaxID=1187855 RepID=A0A931A9I2_9ACTN|nr:DUF998 domain-containing protein [Nonomuraea cypriaca]MBF8185860.1 DUF998 domain-containing protein [Nonomuraea cypriaca]
MTLRRSVWVTVIGALTAMGALAYAQFALPAQPLISDYALVSGGLVPVLAGMLALAGACLSLAYGLARSEPARSAATRVLLLAGAAGLMLSAVFPTDPGMSDVGTMSGEIHRWASAVVFTTLPVAGWSLARGRATAARWNAVKAVSMTSALALAAYLAAHPASITSPLIDGAAYYGLLERAVVLAEIVLVTLMALAFAKGRPATRTQAAPAEPTRAGGAAGNGEAGPRERLAA